MISSQEIWLMWFSAVQQFFTRSGAVGVPSPHELFNTITELNLAGEGPDFLAQVRPSTYLWPLGFSKRDGIYFKLCSQRWVRILIYWLGDGLSSWNNSLVFHASSLPLFLFIRSFINSFIPDIYIALLQVLYYSEVLSTTVLILCQSNMPKCYRQLRVKDLLRALMWWLWYDSNLEFPLSEPTTCHIMCVMGVVEVVCWPAKR